MSCTGRAYLEGIPTDKWIAQKLSSIDLSTPGAAFGIRICHPFNVGQAIEHVRLEAEASYRRLLVRA